MKLSAVLEESLALCIWQSLLVGKDLKSAGYWETALDCVAQKGSWEALFGSSPNLSNLASLSARARASMSDDFDGVGNTKIYLDWPVATHPLLLLAHTAYANTGHGPEVSRTQSINAIEEVVSVSQDHLISTTSPSCHLRKLRAAFLVIKLLSVLSVFKPVDDHVQNEATSLFTAFGSLALAIKLQADENSMRDSEVPEAQELSQHIVRLAIPVMKQVVGTHDLLHEKAKSRFCCCLLLQHLVVNNKPAVCQAVAAELITRGQSVTTCVHARVTMHACRKMHLPAFETLSHNM